MIAKQVGHWELYVSLHEEIDYMLASCLMHAGFSHVSLHVCQCHQLEPRWQGVQPGKCFLNERKGLCFCQTALSCITQQ